MKKPSDRKPLSPEQEMIVAHFLAVTGAFQGLMQLLEKSGAIEQGHFPAALDAIATLYEEKGNDLAAKLVADMRSSLTDEPRLYSPSSQ